MIFLHFSSLRGIKYIHAQLGFSPMEEEQVGGALRRHWYACVSKGLVSRDNVLQIHVLVKKSEAPPSDRKRKQP